MDGPRDSHTVWSMSDTEKQVSYDLLICEILKNGTNKLIYKTETDSQM